MVERRSAARRIKSAEHAQDGDGGADDGSEDPGASGQASSAKRSTLACAAWFPRLEREGRASRTLLRRLLHRLQLVQLPPPLLELAGVSTSTVVADGRLQERDPLPPLGGVPHVGLAPLLHLDLLPLRWRRFGTETRTNTLRVRSLLPADLAHTPSVQPRHDLMPAWLGRRLPVQPSLRPLSLNSFTEFAEHYVGCKSILGRWNRDAQLSCHRGNSRQLLLGRLACAYVLLLLYVWNRPKYIGYPYLWGIWYPHLWGI